MIVERIRPLERGIVHFANGFEFIDDPMTCAFPRMALPKSLRIVAKDCVRSSLKSPKNTAVVDCVQKIFEVHISDGQIIFDGPHLGDDCAKTQACLFPIKPDYEERAIV